MVNKVRWLEPRHMVNVTDRFTRDKRNSLQHALFNGIGYVTMENLWGFWYGMTPHDAEAVNRITRIERAAGPGAGRAPTGSPMRRRCSPGVFASRFPAAERTLWTLVNRNEYAVAGEQLRVPAGGGRSLLRPLARRGADPGRRRRDGHAQLRDGGPGLRRRAGHRARARCRHR